MCVVAVFIIYIAVSPKTERIKPTYNYDNNKK